MQFDFKIRLRFSSDTAKEGVLPVMGDWANGAFERLKVKEGSAHQQIQHDNMVQHRIEVDAPSLWLGVAEILTSEVDDFNALRPGYLETRGLVADTISIKSPAGEINIQFSSERPEISYLFEVRSNPNTFPDKIAGSFGFEFKDQKVWIVFERESSERKKFAHGQAVTVSDAAEFLLSKLV